MNVIIIGWSKPIIQYYNTANMLYVHIVLYRFDIVGTSRWTFNILTPLIEGALFRLVITVDLKTQARVILELSNILDEILLHCNLIFWKRDNKNKSLLMG